MAIELPQESRRRLIESIKRYFVEQMDDEIGDLKASLLLDFCLEELGPSVHNKAIAEAQARIQERTTELDAICYEPEFSYWNKK